MFKGAIHKMQNKNMRLLFIVLISTVAFISVLLIKSGLATNIDHINRFLSYMCNDPPVLDTADFEWSKNFTKQWKVIQNEFLTYCTRYQVPSYADIEPGISGGNLRWKSLFLRVFDNDTEIMNDFPKTKQIINSCPCTTAYFSMIEPRSHIEEHRGIYKGVIRAHLGLKVPRDWRNCFLVVDGVKLHWKEGEMMIFDDMFLHHVENNTDEPRVVLFLDMKRDFKRCYVNMINSIVMRYITGNDTVGNTVANANNLSRRHILF